MSDTVTRADMDRIEKQLDRTNDLLEKQGDLGRENSERLARIEEAMKHRKECPDPGACLALKTRVKKLEEEREQEALEKAKDKGKREGITLSARVLWALIGSGGFGAAVAIWQAIPWKK